MERQTVKSSNIKTVGYDLQTKILEVEFTGGGLYQYKNVERSTYDSMILSESIGKFFNANIKVNHEVVKIDDEASVVMFTISELEVLSKRVDELMKIEGLTKFEKRLLNRIGDNAYSLACFFLKREMKK